MRKAFRFTCLLFSLVICFQVSGLGEAFCEDALLELDCHECIACALQQVVELQQPELNPALVVTFDEPAQDFYSAVEEPSFRFFRPPIAR